MLFRNEIRNNIKYYNPVQYSAGFFVIAWYGSQVFPADLGSQKAPVRIWLTLRSFSGMLIGRQTDFDSVDGGSTPSRKTNGVISIKVMRFPVTKKNSVRYRDNTQIAPIG